MLIFPISVVLALPPSAWAAGPSTLRAREGAELHTTTAGLEDAFGHRAGAEEIYRVGRRSVTMTLDHEWQPKGAFNVRRSRHFLLTVSPPYAPGFVGDEYYAIQLVDADGTLELVGPIPSPFRSRGKQVALPAGIFQQTSRSVGTVVSIHGVDISWQPGPLNGTGTREDDNYLIAELQKGADAKWVTVLRLTPLPASRARAGAELHTTTAGLEDAFGHRAGAGLEEVDPEVVKKLWETLSSYPYDVSRALVRLEQLPPDLQGKYVEALELLWETRASRHGRPGGTDTHELDPSEEQRETMQQFLGYVVRPKDFSFAPACAEKAQRFINRQFLGEDWNDVARRMIIGVSGSEVSPLLDGVEDNPEGRKALDNLRAYLIGDLRQRFAPVMREIQSDTTYEEAVRSSIKIREIAPLFAWLGGPDEVGKRPWRTKLIAALLLQQEKDPRISDKLLTFLIASVDPQELPTGDDDYYGRFYVQVVGGILRAYLFQTAPSESLAEFLERQVKQYRKRSPSDLSKRAFTDRVEAIRLEESWRKLAPGLSSRYGVAMSVIFQFRKDAYDSHRFRTLRGGSTGQCQCVRFGTPAIENKNPLSLETYGVVLAGSSAGRPFRCL